MAKITILFLLSLWLWGCSAHKKDNVPPYIQKVKNLTVIPADAKPAHDIHFTRDATYGDTKTVLIGNIGDLNVSDSGRVFIGNPNRGMFFVFASDGHYLRALGGEGKGPGEFSYFASPSVMDHRLYAYDLSQRRISIFSMDSLRLIRTINLKAANKNTIKVLRGYGLHHVYPRKKGIFMAEFTPNNVRAMNPDSLRQKYFLMNARGKIISHQIFEQKGRGAGVGWLSAQVGGQTRGAGFNFAPHSLMAIANDQHIFAGWTAEFLIKEYDPEGNYLRAVYYPFKKLSLTEDEALELQKGRGDSENTRYLQSILRHVDIPTTWPALHALKVDGHRRLWVATIVKNQDIYQWWVLNEQGKLLARFNWPRAKPIEKIKNNKLYTEETDSSGVPRIVRYQIEMH